ncbi:PUM-HD domain-containing protein [Aphelenchoides fujianensis]|nr:PUM-HD domain-containing protein [Aphelenchoides fujianensis]
MAEKFARRGSKRGGAAKLAKGGVKKAKKPAGKETIVRISSKKNVSFAEELTQDEDSRPIKSVADLSFSSATKGILRKPKAVRTPDSPQKENREERPTETPDEPMDDGAEKPKSLKRGARPKITVKKSVKEKLLAMPKKERREFIRQLRAQKRPDFAVVQDAKKIWEKLRSSKTPADTKEELAQKLWEQVRKSAKKLIFAHDTSRIFQCLLTYASPQVRDEMFDELLPELIRMCRSNYAHFFVVKMLKHKEKRYREVILQAIRGHCVALFRSKLAAKILEYVYNDVATAAQRFDIVSEFYGKEYSLFKQMERNVKSIKEIEHKHPEKIELIVKNLEGPLKSIVEGEQLKHSLAHHLLWNYFTYCTKAQKAEMIESVKDRLPEIVHTREGSGGRHGEILKTFSGHAVQSANDQFARRVLFAIFDSVDDTVIINKNITKELADNVADLVYEKFGVSVLHYIVGPRDPHVFGKTGLVDLPEARRRQRALEEGRRHSATRRSSTPSKDALLPFLAANMREVLTNKTSAVLVLSALKPHDADDLFEREIDDEQKKACFDAIAEMANDEYFPHNMENGKEGPPHILQAGPARFVLKSLLRVDGKQPTVKLSDSLAQLPADQLRLFCAQNSGCFDLLMMLQSGSTAARSAISAAISQKTLEKKTATFVGAGLLLEELRKK